MARVAELSAEPAPIGVVVRRRDRVESEHRVAYAVAAADGRLLHVAGDVDRPIFPRSAIKPLQAIPLLESGAAVRFAVSERELALACASHSGEPEHVRLVQEWLARMGLDGSALECGAHPPLHAPSAERLVATGRPPERDHNNCSGKHAGMMALALGHDWPPAGYIRQEHPVQQRMLALVAEWSGLPEARVGMAVDGCGVITFALPLGSLARMFGRFASVGR